MGVNIGTIWSGPSWQKVQDQTWVPIFYGRKIPTDINGSFASLQNKLALNDISKGGFTHGTQLYLMSQIFRIPIFFSCPLVNLPSEQK